MKLVDILARELAEWPVKEGVYPPYRDYCVQSDECSQVFFSWPHGKILLSRRADKTSGVRVTRAEWQAAVEALKAEQAAEIKWPDGATHYVACSTGDVGGVFYKVFGGRSVSYWSVTSRGTLEHKMNPDSDVGRWKQSDAIERPTERAIEWDGVGLPPVGVVCEHKRLHEWQKVEVFAVKPNYDGSQTALFTYDTGYWCGGSDPSLFRPIRTQEQIAADERKAEILEMIDTFGLDTAIWGRDAVMEICGHLWEAGYRKQVAE